MTQSVIQVESIRRTVLLFALLLLTVTKMEAGNEEFTEPEPEDFAYPTTWLKIGPIKQRMEFAHYRNRMLKLGWDGEPTKALAAAKVDFDAARKLCKDDPRIEYAYGLILWKHDRRGDAIQQFDAAAHLGQNVPPFLPAAQAAAWGRLMENQRESGLRQIASVANALSKSSGAYPTVVQKEDSALFLGRAIEFLKGPGRLEETAEADQRLCDEVSALIPTDLQDEFDRGRQQIDRRYAELKALADRPVEEIESEFQQKQDSFKQQLGKVQFEITRLTEEMDVHSKTQKQWLKGQQLQINQRERALAQIQLGLRDASRDVVRYSTPERHYEYRDVEVEKKDSKGRVSYETERKRVEREETSFERESRLAKLSSAQARGNSLLQMRVVALAELKQLQDERRVVNVRYQKGVSELRADRTRQFRSQRELVAQQKQFEQDFQSPETLKTRVATIAPYVPWDPEIEREALITSYRIAIPANSTP